MTSKISCFDRAVFRRALKKTAPVWILYALYELLLPLRLFSFCRGVSSCTDDFLVQIEKTILGYARINASLLPFLLGGLLAWVLFFWLFRAGTAYFYAALPVRRETLFLTNYLTGVLLCAAPALLSSLLLWAVGAGFGAAAFVPAMQVFAAAMLGFLLFFSFAVLVCCVVGQMAAMPIVYVILNFTFFVLEAIVRHLLFTFVYGMPYSQSSTMQSFALHATPVLGLLQGGFRVATDWAERDGMYYMELNPQLEGWGYLGALAALGLVFALCAFLLLKHREMERSGDVIAVGWLRPVALYVFTIGCALVLGALMAELFSSNTSDNFWYVLLFLFVGAFVGYFVGKHSGELGFVIQVHDEPGKHEYEAAGSGKGIQRVVQNDVGRELVRLRRKRFYDAVHNALHVIVHHRIFDDGHGRLDQDFKFPAHLHFVLKRKVPEERRLCLHGRKKHADHAHCGHHGT